MLDADGADPLRKMMRVQIIVCIMSFFVASAHGALAVYTLRRLKSMQQLPRRTFRRICAFVAASWALYFVGTPSCLALLAMASFLPELATARPATLMTAISFMTTGLLVCLSDGLLTFRTWILWDRPKAFLVLAALITVQVLWILVAGILHATQTVSLTTRQWKRFACLSVSLCVDVSLACASIVRLLQARASLRSAALGSGAHYLTLVRILVFSSTLYTLGCVLTIVFRNNIYASAFYVLDATFLVSGSLAAGRADV